ncbi:hypothetical protein [Helicobacter labetoulli]|uniref:hypothetical protein n=1 Tax=Helicobacter labetoulli TaxID=2315333 RepID=UPI000EF6CB66|nr:hypothetical protein [Helicobacter labetoulli]
MGWLKNTAIIGGGLGTLGYFLYRKFKNESYETDKERYAQARVDSAARMASEAKELELKTERLAEEIEKDFRKLCDAMESFEFGKLYFNTLKEVKQECEKQDKDRGSQEAKAESQPADCAIFGWDDWYDNTGENIETNAMKKHYMNDKLDSKDLERIIEYGQDMFQKVITAKVFARDLEVRNENPRDRAFGLVRIYKEAVEKLDVNEKWRYNDLFNPGLMPPIQVCLMWHLQTLIYTKPIKNFSLAVEKLAHMAIKKYSQRQFCDATMRGCCGFEHSHYSPWSNPYSSMIDDIGKLCANAMLKQNDLEKWIDELDVDKPL